METTLKNKFNLKQIVNSEKGIGKIKEIGIMSITKTDDTLVYVVDMYEENIYYNFVEHELSECDDIKKQKYLMDKIDYKNTFNINNKGVDIIMEKLNWVEKKIKAMYEAKARR